MRKKDIFSIITTPARRIILQRVREAEKAAYSDMFDSVDYIHPLNGTGKFNYHLNFLLKSELLLRNGSVYRLTSKGNDVLDFIEDIHQKWIEFQRVLCGDEMDIFSNADQFEDETGIKMEKEIIDFNGFEMIMDENRIIGLLNLGDDTQLFSTYQNLDISDFRITKRSQKDDDGKTEQSTLLTHPELNYEISPKWFGIIQDFLERNGRDVYFYAQTENPAPFLMRSSEMGAKVSGYSFVIAPSVFDKSQRSKIPVKKN